MKIVHLCRRFWPEQGGVETHVEQIALQELADGHQVSIITLKPSHLPATPETETRKGIRIHRIVANPGGVLHKISVWKGINQYSSILKDATIIQIHDVFWWLLPYLPKYQSKMYITFHGYEPPGPPTYTQKKWHQAAAALTQASMGIGSFHTKWYGVTPNQISFGAVAEKIASTRRSTTTKNRQLRKIMYLGRLSADVGIMTYLEGVKEYLDKHPTKKQHTQIDIFGSGELQETARQYSQKHMLPVDFKGNVPGVAAKATEYDLVFASRHLAILEILSQGKPIIAEYHNEIKRDYLLHQTPFAQWIHPVCIATAIVTLLEKPISLLQPPVVAQEWARKQTWEKLSQQYYQLWSNTRG